MPARGTSGRPTLSGRRGPADCRRPHPATSRTQKSQTVQGATHAPHVFGDHILHHALAALAACRHPLTLGPASAQNRAARRRQGSVDHDGLSRRLSLRAGEETKLNVQLVNYNLAPQRADVAIEGVPAGWTAELRGGGRPVAAAFIEHNNKSTLELRLRVPADTKPGAYTLRSGPRRPTARWSCRCGSTCRKPPPVKLTAEPKLPVLRGTPKSSFDFKVQRQERERRRHPRQPHAQRAARLPGHLQGRLRHAGADLDPAQGRRQQGAVGRHQAVRRPPMPASIPSSSRSATTRRKAIDATDARRQRPADGHAGRRERAAVRRGLCRPRAPVHVRAAQHRHGGCPQHRAVGVAAVGLEGQRSSRSRSRPSCRTASRSSRRSSCPSEKAVTGDYMFAVRANGDGVSESVEVPLDGQHLDAVGRDRPRRDRGAPARAVRRGRPLRPPLRQGADMTTPSSRRKRLTKRYGSQIAVDRLDLHDRQGRGVRPARAQRRGQDDHHPDDPRPDRADQREHLDGRLRSAAPAARGQAPRRLPAGFGRLLRQHDRPRQPALHGAARRHPAHRDRRPHHDGAGARRSASPPPNGRSRPTRAACASGSASPRSSCGGSTSRSSTSRPTASIRSRRVEFLELIRSLKAEGMTVVLSSHLLDLVQIDLRPRRAVLQRQDRPDGARSSDLMRTCSAARPWSNLEADGFRCRQARRHRRHRARDDKLGDGSWRIDATGDVRGEVARRVIESRRRSRSGLSIGTATLQDVYTQLFRGRAPCSLTGRQGNPACPEGLARSRQGGLRSFAGRGAAREGSPWTGLGAVVEREFNDNLTSVRMRLLQALVFVTGFAAAYSAIGQIKDVVGEDPFVFLKIFTVSRSRCRRSWRSSAS